MKMTSSNLCPLAFRSCLVEGAGGVQSLLNMLEMFSRQGIE